MKPSEVFQLAIDKKIPQIVGDLSDGKGSYCAKGLLIHFTKDFDAVEKFEDLLEEILKEDWGKDRRVFDGLRPIAYANDVKHWKWEKFRDVARELETKHE